MGGTLTTRTADMIKLLLTLSLLCLANAFPHDHAGHDDDHSEHDHDSHQQKRAAEAHGHGYHGHHGGYHGGHGYYSHHGKRSAEADAVAAPEAYGYGHHGGHYGGHYGGHHGHYGKRSADPEAYGHGHHGGHHGSHYGGYGHYGYHGYFRSLIGLVFILSVCPIFCLVYTFFNALVRIIETRLRFNSHWCRPVALVKDLTYGE